MDKIELEFVGDKELMKKLKKLIGNTEDALALAVKTGANLLEEEAEALAPGPHIGQKQVYKSTKRVTRKIGPDKDHWYYQFFETGAQPHTIQGRPKLVFPSSNGLVFVRVVHHPGMAPRPFLRPAFDSNKDEVRDKVGKVLKKAIMEEAE